MNDYVGDKPRRITQPLRYCLTSKGQAMVEFTIVFILLIIVAWIPADFGLAFYTSQIAQNAAREGARRRAAGAGAGSRQADRLSGHERRCRPSGRRRRSAP